VTSRERFDAFRAQVDAGEPIDLRALVDEPDPWLRRACLVYVVGQDRELVSNAQLVELAEQLGGKLAAFIRGILILRRARRGDVAAHEVEHFGHAWLRKRLER
jgi:hypothetical protein